MNVTLANDRKKKVAKVLLGDHFSVRCLRNGIRLSVVIANSTILQLQECNFRNNQVNAHKGVESIHFASKTHVSFSTLVRCRMVEAHNQKSLAPKFREKVQGILQKIDDHLNSQH